MIHKSEAHDGATLLAQIVGSLVLLHSVGCIDVVLEYT